MHIDDGVSKPVITKEDLVLLEKHFTADAARMEFMRGIPSNNSESDGPPLSLSKAESLLAVSSSLFSPTDSWDLSPSFKSFNPR